jgi:hypothetical protein
MYMIRPLFMTGNVWRAARLCGLAVVLSWCLCGQDMNLGRPERRHSTAEAATADVFVAPNGSDAWSGTLAAPNAGKSDGPFASVARAQAAVRSLLKTNLKHPPVVMLRDGTYYLPLSPTAPGTLTFTASDSGSAAWPVTWQNYPGETPAVSGGEPVGKGGLGLTWVNAGGSLWQVQLPATTGTFEYLFYNGERRLRSRVQSPSSTSVGYYMSGGACHDSQAGKAVDISNCNLGTYLRVANTVAPSDPAGAGCPSETNSDDSTQSKCMDRFYYNPADPIAAWQNLAPTVVNGQTCTLSTHNAYPQGDVQITLIQAWSVSVMRVSCVDTANHVVYFTASTLVNPGSYPYFGPTKGHRYIVENTKDAFDAARTAGQAGLWFLDRSKSPWVLNYLANAGENPNSDTVVIAQTQPVSGTYPGGSLISAANLKYVTFRGIVFEVDNYVSSPQGFNNDDSPEYNLPQAIDCESCQNVVFDGISVRHTSASGLLIASSSGNSGAPASNDIIQNSAFYDLGDCGIRIGHKYAGSDKPANVPQNVTVQNNLVQGYSRVFPDGRGIALAQGHDMVFQHNDVNDGYHAGISICNTPCSSHQANAANITTQYNHIWNVMQGVTSDGGTLYYSSGAADGAATGNYILNNLIHDNTDSSIIDNGVGGSGYGGDGIYLDSQTAGVDVENNVVYRVSGNASAMTQGPAAGQPPNTFKNNIFAYALNSMFFEQAPWPQGCVNPSARVNFINNIVYFDKTDSSGFYVTDGCAYSCELDYNKFQNFQKNLYWRTDGKFASYAKAFHVSTNSYSDASTCNGQTPKQWTFLGYAGWTGGKPPNGDPGAMNEDAGSTVTVNPSFGNTGAPADFLLSANLVSGFDYTKTNDTILHAGRTNAAIQPPAVPQTMPVYHYASF